MNYSINNPVIIDDHGKSELNMNLFWQLTAKCIKSLIIKSKIKKMKLLVLVLQVIWLVFGQ